MIRNLVKGLAANLFLSYGIFDNCIFGSIQISAKLHML